MRAIIRKSPAPSACPLHRTPITDRPANYLTSRPQSALIACVAIAISAIPLMGGRGLNICPRFENCPISARCRKQIEPISGTGTPCQTATGLQTADLRSCTETSYLDDRSLPRRPGSSSSSSQNDTGEADRDRRQSEGYRAIVDAQQRHETLRENEDRWNQQPGVAVRRQSSSDHPRLPESNDAVAGAAASSRTKSRVLPEPEQSRRQIVHQCRHRGRQRSREKRGAQSGEPITVEAQLRQRLRRPEEIVDDDDDVRQIGISGQPQSESRRDSGVDLQGSL